MAYAVQNTIGNQDHSLFHHNLIKILIQFQLSTIYMSWDQLLVENGFGQTKFWPPSTSKSRLKRRKHYISKIHTFNPNPNPNEEVNNNHTLLNDLGNNTVDDNIIPVTGIFVNSQPERIGKIPTQKHENLVKI